jgi:hypothetical protein
MILSWRTLTSVTLSVLFTVLCLHGKERQKQGGKAVGRGREKGLKSQVMEFSNNRHWIQLESGEVRMGSRRESEASNGLAILIKSKRYFF